MGQSERCPCSLITKEDAKKNLQKKCSCIDFEEIYAVILSWKSIPSLFLPGRRSKYSASELWCVSVKLPFVLLSANHQWEYALIQCIWLLLRIWHLHGYLHKKMRILMFAVRNLNHFYFLHFTSYTVLDPSVNTVVSEWGCGFKFGGFKHLRLIFCNLGAGISLTLYASRKQRISAECFSERGKRGCTEPFFSSPPTGWQMWKVGSKCQKKTSDDPRWRGCEVKPLSQRWSLTFLISPTDYLSFILTSWHPFKIASRISRTQPVNWRPRSARSESSVAWVFEV